MMIDEADLEVDEDRRLYQGRPFTGTARAFHENGVLKQEWRFSDGFEEGLCQEWHNNGRLKRAWNAVRGVATGRRCEWHDTGDVKTIAVYLKGVELEFSEWSVEGRLLAHRELDRRSTLWKYATGGSPSTSTDSG